MIMLYLHSIVLASSPLLLLQVIYHNFIIEN